MKTRTTVAGQKKVTKQEQKDIMAFQNDSNGDEISNLASEENRYKFESPQAVSGQPHAGLLRLIFQIEKYITDRKFDPALNFGYFFNEYIKRQEKLDKQIAIEMGVTDAAISQLINNRRKPTKEFIIRLEIHSGGLFPALFWAKLLHKEKEYEIATDLKARIKASQHIKAT
jgi:plasmid maintenance system antidote protein VapI